MKEKKIKLSGLLRLGFFPLTVLYLELLLRVSAGLPPLHDGLPSALLTSFGYAMAAAALVFLPRGRKGRFALCLILTELFCLWYTLGYFIYDSYKVFMSPAILISEAGNAAKDFGGNISSVFVNGFVRILVYQLPLLFVIALHKRLRADTDKRGPRAVLALILCAVFFVGGHFGAIATPTLKEQYREQYTYDNAVRNFGLFSALTQELWHNIFPNSAAEEKVFATPAPTATPDLEDKESEKTYAPHVMDIDFEERNTRGDPTVSSLNNYVLSLDPDTENGYTGIFEGKNLILITAEAFTKELIDPRRTPTLYRLATKGIVFEDFYQPAWGGSTSTGEYSWLMGIAPTFPTAMTSSANNNMYFTMGNQLQRLGYSSWAYHNGSFDYYNRNLTHPNLGYSHWIAIGSGLEGMSSGFPKSDWEMFENSLPMYIDAQPFSVYYMSISGHASYAFSNEVNDMSVKNQNLSETWGMEGYSEEVRAYYACNQELEFGLSYILSQLEERGLEDDTVIAICSDHYPYGLTPSSAWGSKTNHLEELYGYPIETNAQRDHNAAIIWCGSLEDEEPIHVSAPTSSLDLLPTLSNLFGLEYDSRLMAGRDVFSDSPALVFWNDYSWKTEKGYYDNGLKTFFPAEGYVEEEGYVEQMKEIVENKLWFSKNVSIMNYYGILFGRDEVG